MLISLIPAGWICPKIIRQYIRLYLVPAPEISAVTSKIHTGTFIHMLVDTKQFLLLSLYRCFVKIYYSNAPIQPTYLKGTLSSYTIHVPPKYPCCTPNTVYTVYVSQRSVSSMLANINMMKHEYRIVHEKRIPLVVSCASHFQLSRLILTSIHVIVKIGKFK